MPHEPTTIYRFGRFEFDGRRERLRRSGMSVKLPPQPSRLLGLLLQRAGNVVSREEIREHLWPGGICVDHEQGINHCVRRIRAALRDDAATARFVETLPRIGYRFFAGVQVVAGNVEEPDPALGAVTTLQARETVGPSKATSVAVGTAGSLPVPSRRRWWHVVAIVAFAALGVAVVARGLDIGRLKPGSVGRSLAPFERIRLEKLTTQRNLWSAALSPDGVYVAYALWEPGEYVVRVRAIGSEHDVRVVEPQEMPLRGLTFSPDGSRIYFLRAASHGPGYSALFEVPTLGGEPRQVLFDVDSAVGFSPEGDRIAFVRGDPPNRRGHLLTSRLDGTDERWVATWSSPDTLLAIRPAWAPDGQRIAVAVRRGRFEAPVDLVVADLEGEGRKTVGGGGWDAAGGFEWLSDGSGLLWVGEEPEADDRLQIWRIDYPSGDVHHVSRDLGSYQGLSLSRDDAGLVTMRRDREAAVWSFAIESASSADSPARPEVEREGNADSGANRWTDDYTDGRALLAVRRGPDAGVIFTAQRSGRTTLWRQDAAGEPPVRLLPGSAPDVRAVSVSPDGETVVFVAAGNDGRPHLWTVPGRGGVAAQLTWGGGEVQPGVCDDGTVFFRRLSHAGLWSLQAGDTRLRKAFDLAPYSTLPVCSPGGRRIAFDTGVQSDGNVVRTLIVLPTRGGKPTHRIPWPNGRLLAWHPDGNALTYMGEPRFAPEIWRVDLDGEQTSLVRSTRNGNLYSFDWSTDGKTLLASHGRTRQYAVRISQSR